MEFKNGISSTGGVLGALGGDHHDDSRDLEKMVAELSSRIKTLEDENFSLKSTIEKLMENKRPSSFRGGKLFDVSQTKEKKDKKRFEDFEGTLEGIEGKLADLISRINILEGSSAENNGGQGDNANQSGVDESADIEKSELDKEIDALVDRLDTLEEVNKELSELTKILNQDSSLENGQSMMLRARSLQSQAEEARIAELEDSLKKIHDELDRVNKECDPFDAKENIAQNSSGNNSNM